MNGFLPELLSLCIGRSRLEHCCGEDSLRVALARSAAINYRLTTDSPLPAPVHDAARAVQFLRTKAAEWSIDTKRICLTGGSAGACTAMWLLCHDDLAEPESKDPILRESTRVAGAAVLRGQTSIDPQQIEPWLGPNVRYRCQNYILAR